MQSPSSPTGAIAVPELVPQLLRDIIHERTGIHFEDDRLDVMIEKLTPRAAARGCKSFLDYYYILRYDERDCTDEWRRVMDTFSVQETYFWREFDQIRALTDVVVPEWFKHRVGPFRIWSAACATGEEPYTIALALQEAGWGTHPIEIVGSDASEAALEKARSGIFRERSFRVLPANLREKYFQPVEGGFQLRRELVPRVQFRFANLQERAQIEPLAGANAIFCRNVFIYFSPAAIKRVVSVFAERMPEDGHLFVGASESLVKLTDDFELDEVAQAFVYRRKENKR